MKFRLVLAVLLLVIIVFAGGAAEKHDPYSQARDFPRGPMVYAQAADLPALIKKWNNSTLKANYFGSQNFADLKNRHLGLKLASRWQEFCDAAGFSFDLESIAAFTNNRAAFALYDVGRLDFVFIAPMSDEVFAATQFMGSDKFEQEDLANGVTTVYHVSVDADRGRQKQELLFTHIKGRLVVATSEDLISRTIANIAGNRKKDRLSDEPAFAQLKDKVEPHKATVWIDQAALNKDYYFKRYWLMGSVDRLKNVRSGLFDLSIDDTQAVEHRAFLTDKPKVAPLFTAAERAAAVGMVPNGVPFIRVNVASQQLVNDAVEQTISINRNDPAAGPKTRTFRYENTAGYDDEDSHYHSLGEEFDEDVNESDDPDTMPTQSNDQLDLTGSLRASGVKTVTTFTRPETLPLPIFAEFHRGAIFELAARTGFDRSLFEAQIEKLLLHRVTVPASGVALEWKTLNSDGALYRDLKLPAINCEVSYGLRENQLVLTNDEGFLREILKTGTSKRAMPEQEALSELTLIDLDSTKDGFNKIFEHLKVPGNDIDFLYYNVGGLLDVFSDVETIEIKKRNTGNIVTEDLLFRFKKMTDRRTEKQNAEE